MIDFTFKTTIELFKYIESQHGRLMTSNCNVRNCNVKIQAGKPLQSTYTLLDVWTSGSGIAMCDVLGRNSSIPFDQITKIEVRV